MIFQGCVTFFIYNPFLLVEYSILKSILHFLCTFKWDHLNSKLDTKYSWEVAVNNQIHNRCCLLRNSYNENIICIMKTICMVIRINNFFSGIFFIIYLHAKIPLIRQENIRKSTSILWNIFSRIFEDNPTK